MLKTGKAEDGIWSNDLRCFWLAACPTADNEITISVPQHSCTDMGGAIRFAKSLMPSVVQVFVMADGRKDILYKKSGAKWIAYDYRK